VTLPHRYVLCKGCGKHRDEAGGELSATGLCLECGIERVKENATGISEHRGSAFTRWRRGMAACVGAVILDGPDVKP